MAKFFIDRPVFAWVIAILIMLAGAMSVLNLPIQQYPTIAPPSIRIVAQYPGASADTREESVTQIIEQNMSGIDNMLYIKRQIHGGGVKENGIELLRGFSADQSGMATKFRNPDCSGASS